MSTVLESPIKKVALNYSPNLNHEVGEYYVKATISHNDATERCYNIRYSIEDFDECASVRLKKRASDGHGN